MKTILILTLPLLLMSCAAYDVSKSNVAMERDETRLFNEASPASDDPDSPLSDLMLQRGRVGINAARF